MNVDIESLGPVPEGSILLLRGFDTDGDFPDDFDEIVVALQTKIGHDAWVAVYLSEGCDLSVAEPEVLAAALVELGWTVTAP